MALTIDKYLVLEVVGLLERFLNEVFHSFRLLCVRSVDVMASSHLLFFCSIILSTDLVPASTVVLPNGLLE